MANGYTLVELLIATTVSAVVTISFLAAVPVLYDDFQLGRFNQRLSAWVLSLENLYLSRVDYQGLNLQTVVELGLLDEEHVEKDGEGRVTSVRHMYGGDLEVSIPTGLSQQYWAIHLNGVPVRRVCVSALQHALRVGRFLAVVDERGAGRSHMSDWLSAVQYDVSKLKLVNLPGTYTTVQNLDGSRKSTGEIIEVCDAIVGQTMGLALIRKKM